MLNSNTTSPEKPQDPQRAGSLRARREENEEGVGSRSNETNKADGWTQANQTPGRRAIWLETWLGGGVEPMTAGWITDEKEWGLWQSKNLFGLKV